MLNSIGRFVGQSQVFRLFGRPTVNRCQNLESFSIFQLNLFRSMSSEKGHGIESNEQDLSANKDPTDSVRERARKRIAELEAEQSLSPNSPVGIMERSPGQDPNNVPVNLPVEDNQTFAPFANNVNPVTGEVSGPTGPEPTRFGDWERKGRCSDF